MANFQVIFSGNEDELSRFILAWKMSSEIKRYDELKSQIEELERRVKELRDKILELENERMKLQKEIAELAALRESARRELTIRREE
ncbi:MAG: hypothetical protein QXU12_00325 [Nitrososphaerota archaeon]